MQDTKALPETIRLRRKDINRLARAVATALVEAGEGSSGTVEPLLHPPGAKPFTVLIEFGNDDDTVVGNTAYTTMAPTPEAAVLQAQREVYLSLTASLPVRPDDLTIFASAVFAGHHAPVWTAALHDGPPEGSPDPEEHHDPAYYDPARDPYFGGQ